MVKTRLSITKLELIYRSLVDTERRGSLEAYWLLLSHNNLNYLRAIVTVQKEKQFILRLATQWCKLHAL